MAVSTKTGTISILTTDSVGATQAITCGFAPKFVLFWATKNSSATDNVVTGDAGVSFGMATSSTNRASVGMEGSDNTGTINDARVHRNDAVICQVTSAGVVSSLLDISSFDADGFTVIVDDAFVVNTRVSYFAVGGSDITDATIGWLTAPGSTGNNDTTSLSFQPDYVMFAANSMSVDANATDANRSGFMLGAMCSDGTQGVSATGNGPESNADSQAKSYSYDGECIAILSDTPTSIGCRASYVSMLSNGFRVNFTEAGTAYRIAYLAVKGGNWEIGNFNSSTSVNTTFAESGFGFQPTGGVVVSHGNAKSTQDTVDAQGRMSIGAFSSTSERVAQAYIQRDAQATIDSYRAIEYDEVYIRLSDTGTVDGLIDVSSIDSGGVTFIQDDADTTSSFVWYVAVGSNSGVTGTLSATIDNVTLSATGTLPIVGTLSTSIGNITSSATGTLAIVGTLSATIADVTLSGAGTLAITGALSATIDNVTLLAMGTLAIVGTLDTSIGDITLSGEGTSVSGADLDVTIGDITLSATGVLPIVGAANVSIGDVTLSSAGVLPIVGAASITLGDITLSAAGALLITGTTSATIDNFTLAATGTLPILGTATNSIGDVTLTAIGLASYNEGTLSASIGNVTLSATAYAITVTLMYGTVKGVSGVGSVRNVSGVGTVKTFN